MEFGIEDEEREQMKTISSLITFLLIIFSTNEVLGGATPVPPTGADMLLQESIVHHLNSHPNAGWKAAMSPRFANHTVRQFKHLLGGLKSNNTHLYHVKSYDLSFELPTNFDARIKWPQCKSIGRVLDQGHCGFCWAFAAVGVLTDRFCIHHDKDVHLSENDLLACCGRCGHGCHGGSPLDAFGYFLAEGVVSDKCDPYFDPYGCDHRVCGDETWPTPWCRRRCMTENEAWHRSKRFGDAAYLINTADPRHTMMEIYKNGPVTARFITYLDFAYYQSGVYSQTWGGKLGAHIVKLIGWGTTDEGEDYWLAVNSWNSYWGDEGLFKLRRGFNECGIEESIHAGMPSLRNFHG